MPLLLAVLPPILGLAGYIAAMCVLTPAYQIFQAANNAQALTDLPEALRGTIAGLLGLEGNLSLVGGASAMGATSPLVSAPATSPRPPPRP